MSKYLKSKQEYVDLYDRLTVNDCRWRENFHKNSKPSEELAEKVSEKFYQGVSEIALHYDLLYATVRWWEDKDKTISEWISRDTKKDEFYESAQAPQLIRCSKCQSLTTESSKIFMDGSSDKPDRILFMYDCPNGCVPHRAFYNNGEEYKIKPHICVKCEGEMQRTSERVDEKKIITTETCGKCGHVETDEMDISHKEEIPDPDYEKDRERFCLSGEALRKNLDEKANLEGIAKFMDEQKEKEKHKEEYDKINNLKKLTVPQLKQFVVDTLKDEPYSNLIFEQPSMESIVSIGFTIEDPAESNEYNSRTKLARILKKNLEETNWRLMSDGINYRLGILSGRFRIYEREEDLLKLVKDKSK
ncbi:MAG: hypothetical protein MUD00_02110 [Candidatus Pacebacteria bacterium]|jgi:hypothetical protein|nr:hypothetical protein [Candidatus Paceibacterota bacterium]